MSKSLSECSTVILALSLHRMSDFLNESYSAKDVTRPSPSSTAFACGARAYKPCCKSPRRIRCCCRWQPLFLMHWSLDKGTTARFLPLLNPKTNRKDSRRSLVYPSHFSQLLRELYLRLRGCRCGVPTTTLCRRRWIYVISTLPERFPCMHSTVSSAN